MDVMRKVITIFDVQGAERVRAQLGLMSGGFQNQERTMRQGIATAGLLDKQLRALGTTIRYAFSGSAVYGTIQIVRSLGEFESKLGDISAIATGTGGVNIVGQQLDQLGEGLIKLSNETAQPISDLQEGVLNLYSTIGNVPQNEAVSLMETISKTASTSQSNIQDTTQALLGMMNAFGRGTGSVKKFGDEFYTVIAQSAGMPGSIYAQKLGVLSARASLAGFTPEQMGALAIGATRSGGSPTTNMQYLAQFMQSLFNPQTKKNESEMASLGLGASQRKKMSAWQVFNAYMSAVQRAGGLKGSNMRNIANAGNALSLDDQSTAGLGQFGITGGGSDIINKSFGRLQSRTMAAILYNVFSPQQTKGTKNKTLEEYLKEVTGSAKNVDSAMERAMDRKRIVQAGNAMHNFGIEMGIAMNPLLNPIAKAITPVSTAFGNQTEWHKSAEVAALVGGAGLALKLRGLSGSRAAARGVAGIGAGVDVLTETARGETPLKPLYVAIVYSLAGNGPLGGLGSGGRRAEGEVTAAEKETEKVAKRSSRLSRFAKKFGPLSAIGGPELLAGYIGASMLFGDSVNENGPHIVGTSYLKGSGQYQEYMAGLRGHLPNAYGNINIGNGGTTNFRDPAYMAGLKKYESTLTTAQLARVERTLSALGANGGVNLKGQANVDVTIKDTSGNKLGTKKVTLDLFPDFTTKAPMTRAKSKTQRGT